MSGRVHVKGDASQAAGATGCGGLLVVDGNASARCGISMKGIDIVVKGSVGHMSAFMAQAGNLVVLGDAGEALGDSIYEAQLYVRGKVEEPRRRLHREGHARRAQGGAAPAARAAGLGGEVDVSEFRRYGSARKLYHFHIDNARVLLMSGGDDRWIHTPPRKSATFDRHTIAEIRRAAATGIYDIRGFGAKRKLPHFDDLLFLGASISRYPLEGYREKCATDVTLGTRFAKKPITLKIPITIAGMSFGSLSAPAKEALGRGASRRRHLDHDRRRRHDAGGARAFHAAGLSGAALALRHEPGRPAQGRRHRGRGRAGRQARRRRHAARPEDLRARRRDAHAAARASTSARPAGIPTGPGPTISRSRSRSCARSPIGRSRSTSRSARRGPITTRRWP